MEFDSPLQQGYLLRRYKRFLADILLSSGEKVTAYCPNTGAMTNCIVENSPCWFSVSDNPKRKYSLTLEITATPDGCLAGIHSARANSLVKEAIENGVIEELQGYSQVKTEVCYGEEKSRIDFLLKAEGKSDCYVEVKSVTLGMGEGLGLFPDAVSARGVKHIRELQRIAQSGKRAILFFCVQHTGITTVSPAHDIDPKYGETLQQAIKNGVEVIVYGADITPQKIELRKPLVFVE